MLAKFSGPGSAIGGANVPKPWLAAYEEGVRPSLDYPPQPLQAFLDHAVRSHGDRTALVFYGARIRYRDLDRMVNRLAAALRERFGIRPGDRVAIMLPNVPQCVIAYYAVLKAGAVVVQTNPLYVERELEFQLADSGARVLIALDLFFDHIPGRRIAAVLEKTLVENLILTNIRDHLPRVLRWLYPLKARRENQWAPVKAQPPVHDWNDVLHRSSDAPLESVSSPDDPALFQYTGGTTGTPKGVVLTHANLVANTVQCREWMKDLREGQEVFLAVIPFFHVYGMTACMNLSILLASSMVLLPRFQTDDVLKAIARYRPTIFPGVQAMYVAINNHPKTKETDIRSIRACISGAGPLHREVQERFESLTGGRVVEGYGLTEASPVTHCNPIYGKRKPGSIGLPFPDTECRIVDTESGTRELSPGEVGELCVRGPQVMRGYWRRKDETDAVLADGWLRTGDMARMDEEGYFFIVDRKKDMIKTRGENVYPREVEEVLYRHPKVREAVVIGLPEAFSNEVIKAYVVLKEGERAGEEEILEFCRRDLAKFKVPQTIEFRTELPKTMVGKVLRRVLMEEEMAKRPAGGH